MSPIVFLRFVIGATIASASLAYASEACDGQCPEIGSPGSALLQTGTYSPQLLALETPAILETPAVPAKTMFGTDLPFYLQNKMILPDPWKCPFYNGDWRVCDDSGSSTTAKVAQAGLIPGKVTEKGKRMHEVMNTYRVAMPLGTVPCCPTPPFCSAPRCTDSFLENRASAPPAVCTKRSAADNFAYMTGQQEWPAYFAHCGGYPFDVQKHWNVLTTVLGCPESSVTCTRAETFDLVIDLGSNYGIVTEELTNRHFAKSYINVDAAPFGPDFGRRKGNLTWRKLWIDEQVPKRRHQVEPSYEFHQYGLTNSEGEIDLCKDVGYNGGVPCPVPKASPDTIIPGRLSPAFQVQFKQAQSAFVKIDVEGYDMLTMMGMTKLFQETRGVYPDDSPRHLINFMMFEYGPSLMDTVKDKEHLFGEYNLRNMTSFLEAQGFEVFAMGPRYLPLTHGSWDDKYLSWFSALRAGATAPNCPKGKWYPHFPQPAASALGSCIFATDLFAIRASHPKAADIKVALGACEESKDFDPADPQYDMSEAANM